MSPLIHHTQQREQQPHTYCLSPDDPELGCAEACLDASMPADTLDQHTDVVWQRDVVGSDVSSASSGAQQQRRCSETPFCHETFSTSSSHSLCTVPAAHLHRAHICPAAVPAAHLQSRFAARFSRIQKRRKCEPGTSQRRLISQRTSDASGAEGLLQHGAFGLADQHCSHTGDLWDSGGIERVPECLLPA
ncbi:hypothetical protein SRHO_G00166030 [Serrasalmus rhombeus]